MSEPRFGRTRSSLRSAQVRPLTGVVQTIADGLTIALQRPRLLLLPLLVDLVLWLLLQVSIQPLADNVAEVLAASGAGDAALAAEQLTAVGDHVRASDALSVFLPSIFSGLAVDSLLNGLVFFLLPRLAMGIDREAMYGNWENGLLGVWTPGSPGAVAGIMLALLILGSLLVVAYRVPLARTVRGDATARRQALQETAVGWVHFLGYLVLLMMIGVALVVPVMLASVVFLVLGFELAFVLTIALLIFGGMAGISTLFVLDAMLLHRIGPVQGIAMSVRVARAYFGQTTRFALTSLLLATGALQVWSTTVQNAPGIAIALVANAFLGTGLSLASMLFYAERFRHIRAASLWKRS